MNTEIEYPNAKQILDKLIKFNSKNGKLGTITTLNGDQIKPTLKDYKKKNLLMLIQLKNLIDTTQEHGEDWFYNYDSVRDVLTALINWNDKDTMYRNIKIRDNSNVVKVYKYNMVNLKQDNYETAANICDLLGMSDIYLNN
ncbi:hypothetical protein PT285_08000 [Lactobacillus sp. ESL0791]|uniref:hypothetical protein n=1 Tax=Lactobacillus sp. ESL0791 TaxID=2983234 RepID=UPI0023F951E0|nr:hypothetical protein [Lactobacillus sp. ESL0791]MDF7639339.1 hypothetical protein [Lactobacillus sp. ESL0791]